MIGKTAARHRIITKLWDLATEVVCQSHQIRTNQLFSMTLEINQFTACSCRGLLGLGLLLQDGASRKGLV